MLYGTVTEFCGQKEVSSKYQAFMWCRSSLGCSFHSVQSCRPGHGQYDNIDDLTVPSRTHLIHSRRYEYLWEDGVTYRRPTKLPAPVYIDNLMNWVQGLLDDETVFPSKIGECAVVLKGAATATDLCLLSDVTPRAIFPLGVPFPRNFRDTVKTICRRLFRVYAHLYSNHFEQICALGIEGPWGWGAVNRSLVDRVYAQPYTAHLNTSYRHFFLFINEVSGPPYSC